MGSAAGGSSTAVPATFPSDLNAFRSPGSASLEETRSTRADSIGLKGFSSLGARFAIDYCAVATSTSCCSSTLNLFSISRASSRYWSVILCRGSV